MEHIHPEVQALIDRMKTGDPDAILEGLHHGGVLLQVNAAICMTHYKLTSKEFLDGLYAMMNDNFVLLGYRIYEYCICALDILGIEKYTGDDERIKRLADSKFDFYWE